MRLFRSFVNRNLLTKNQLFTYVSDNHSTSSYTSFLETDFTARCLSKIGLHIKGKFKLGHYPTSRGTQGWGEPRFTLQGSTFRAQPRKAGADGYERFHASAVDSTGLVEAVAIPIATEEWRRMASVTSRESFIAA